MINGSRDLLVVSKFESLTDKELDRQLVHLNQILFSIESMNTYAVVNEVLDLNKYKVITKPHLVAQAIRQGTNKPFVFIYNKN